MEDRRTPTAVRLALVVLALLSVVLVLAGTREGPGTTPDGVSYLGAAENLADGRGLTGAFVTSIDPFTPRQAAAFDGEVPFLQWPPLYPVALGVPTAAGAEATDAARWASAAGLAAVVALTGWLAARLVQPATTPVRLAAAVAAALVVLVQPYLALLSVLVASELVYVPLALAALWCATRRLAGGSPRWLVAALALGSLATLARFVGVSVVAAVVLAELVWGPGAPAARARRALGGGALAVVPALGWSWWVGRSAGEGVRTLVWHPPDRAQWELAGTSLVEWVVAPDRGLALRAVVLAATAAVVALAVLGWLGGTVAGAGAGAGAEGGGEGERPTAPVGGDGRPPGAGLDEGRGWLRVAGLAAALYLVAVVATHALVDRVVPVGQRLFTPLVPLVAVTIVVGVGRAVGRPVAGAGTGAGAAGPATDAGRRRRWVAGLAALALAAVVVGDHASAWWDLTRPGRSWPADPATTPTGTLLGDLPEGTLVASNDPALAWQSSGQFTIAVPVRTSAPTGQRNERFADDLAELGEVLREGDGVAVVYALSSLFNPNTASVDELVAGADLEVVATFDDAVVLAPAEGTAVGTAGPAAG